MTPRSALLVRLSSLGDVAQALPLLGALALRGVRTGWVVEDRCAPLLGFARWPVETLVWRRGLGGLLALRGQGRGFDAVLDVQGNWKSGLVARLLGAGRRIGLAASDRREPSSRWLGGERAPPAKGPHVLDRGCRVLEAALGQALGKSDLLPPPWLRVADADVERVRTVLRSRGIDVERGPVAVVAGRSADPRSWPLQHAVDLVQRLGSRGFLLLGPAESAVAVPAGVAAWRQEPGALRDLVALGELLARTSGHAIGPDGGAMHVLHAAGARATFLFGPQDPARTGPLHGAVVVAPGALECRPCLRRRCALPAGNECMARIEPDAVLAAVGSRR